MEIKATPKLEMQHTSMQNNTPCLRDLIRARLLCEKKLKEALVAYEEKPWDERRAVAVNIAAQDLLVAKINIYEYERALFRYKNTVICQEEE